MKLIPTFYEPSKQVKLVTAAVPFFVLKQGRMTPLNSTPVIVFNPEHNPKNN
jgi:hypothetical protein